MDGGNSGSIPNGGHLMSCKGIRWICRQSVGALTGHDRWECRSDAGTIRTVEIPRGFDPRKVLTEVLSR